MGKRSRTKGQNYERADFLFFADIGFTTGEMARAVGRSASTIRQKAKEYGVKFPNKPSAERRFHKNYEVVSESGCWIWTGADRGNGYGCLMIDNVLVSAHRFSYELYYSPIPAGHFVCHRCDVPACVNPHHLFTGLPVENNDDKLRKGRDNPPSGLDHHACKLSDADILKIQSSRDRASTLADYFGVNVSTVCKIKKGSYARLRGIGHGG